MRPIAYSPKRVWVYEVCDHCGRRVIDRLKRNVFEPVDAGWQLRGVFTLEVVDPKNLPKPTKGKGGTKRVSNEA